VAPKNQRNDLSTLTDCCISVTIFFASLPATDLSGRCSKHISAWRFNIEAYRFSLFYDQIKSNLSNNEKLYILSQVAETYKNDLKTGTPVHCSQQTLQRCRYQTQFIKPKNLGFKTNFYSPATTMIVTKRTNDKN